MTLAPDHYDYIVVDGFNLALRAQHAISMSTLTDKKGRPTGLVFGFLRSLNSLLKRFPGAKVWVCWDGSNQRRKERYPEYKAKRGTLVLPTGDWNPLAMLKEILTLCGVSQAFNPEEEADDVIASLIRGPFAENRVLILSTDRDFMQLVSEKVNQFAPKPVANAVVLFGPKEVEEAWGVPPHQLLDLRSLLGDTSDGLPGIGKLPKQQFISLVKMYGSLDGIFDSNLAGIKKNAYERIRGAERQVRLNYELMKLVTVPYQEVPGARDPVALRAKLADVDINPDAFPSFLNG